MSSSLKSRPIKPNRLPKNGTIAITSPASTPDAIQLERGIKYLESHGYRIIVGKSCEANEDYLAGSDDQRAAELMRFFTDDSVHAIFCSRGGYGGMHLLPRLNYSAMAKSRKLFCGFSDITALQWSIYAQCKMVTVSGGMVATDFGRDQIDPEFESNFWELIDGGSSRVKLNPTSGENRVIVGRILPGTLAVAAKQIGTTYFPTTQGHILIFEDIGEPDHKIEGYLRQFGLAGHLKGAKAVVLGEFTPPEKSTDEFSDLPGLEKLTNRVASDFKTNFWSGIRYGHIKNKISLPLGLSFCLSLGNHSELYSTESLYDP